MDNATFIIMLFVFVSLVTFFMRLIFLVCLCEARLVWPYKTIFDSKEAYRNISQFNQSYIASARNEFKNNGFIIVGLCSDAKGGQYNLTYEFYLSQDGSILAILGYGTIFVFKLSGTWLISKIEDGRCLVTIDNQPASDIDISGQWREQLHLRPGVGKLIDHHRTWITQYMAQPRAFSEENALKEYEQCRRKKYEFLHSLGYIRFLDAEREKWKYTIKGAFKFTIIAFFKGLARGMYYKLQGKRIQG
jgi:hypothetical protein